MGAIKIPDLIKSLGRSFAAVPTAASRTIVKAQRTIASDTATARGAMQAKNSPFLRNVRAANKVEE